MEDTLEKPALFLFLSSSQLQFILSLSFYLLLLGFTLFLCILLVPLRQLLADSPVPKYPASDSYLWWHMISFELGLVHQSWQAFLSWINLSCPLEEMLRQQLVALKVIWQC